MSLCFTLDPVLPRGHLESSGCPRKCPSDHSLLQTLSLIIRAEVVHYSLIVLITSTGFHVGQEDVLDIGCNFLRLVAASSPSPLPSAASLFVSGISISSSSSVP
ncbi:hypothetical protein AMECASPLE_000098 [Ameca splendens]|uniref:Uncharacterized protein n=1 Tax=Ameca splendens TaxID=208324 RepID=A0ABV0ZI40_9TELE